MFSAAEEAPHQTQQDSIAVMSLCDGLHAR